ncbi:GGDEF domain-containing protein [Vibrio cholerae]|uniref:sensor domain-containing diguanylate cyclase n=2 Tax=Vibrio cholerae TaxID=666 RepID=UPI001A20A2CF|nr:sensor domain-containing diguanylate cyclase [Vibrio cholerae]EGR1075814.1 GGDEF domain-containing protein [Vibrio cholerae]HAS3380647.1 diguanylate cyclase [Vibrio cholerae]HAS3409606.1 diguanylate cyclase [Vibrio cholerae]HDI3142298.1 GGDEF domain-containing protein [Vibrio cholerae]
MNNSIYLSSRNYLLTKVCLFLSISIVLFTIFMVSMLYRDHVNFRIDGYNQLLTTLETTYIHEMVKENERQLCVIINTLDRLAILEEKTAFNPIWVAAHRIKMDRGHQLYFYNSSTNEIDSYPEWIKPENFHAPSRPWFELLDYSDSTPRWIGPYVEFGRDRRVLTLGQKVFAPNGKTIGLMMVDMPIDNIDRVLERMVSELDISLFLKDSSKNIMFSVINEGFLKLGRVGVSKESLWMTGLYNGALLTKNLSYVDWELGIYIPAERFRKALVSQVLIMLIPIFLITFVAILGINSLLGVFYQELRVVESNIENFDSESSLSSNEVDQVWFIGRSLNKIKQQYESQRKLLRTDPLTKIQNRRAFNSDLSSMEMVSDRYALWLIDVDKFKLVNDTWGHQFGDCVLKRVAKVLQQNLKTDCIYRIGGDEFAVLVPFIDFSLLVDDLDGVILSIRNQQWREANCSITLSIGVGIGPCCPSELFNKADSALYRSKDSGRDCWNFA